MSGGDIGLDAILDTLASMAEEIAALKAGGVGRAQSYDDEIATVDWEPWAEWLWETYRLANTLPIAWKELPAAVEEVKALHAAWVVAYDVATGDPLVGDAATRWHGALAAAIGRISDMWARYNVSSQISGIRPTGRPWDAADGPNGLAV